MTSPVTIGRATLYLGDCRTVDLPPVDAVVSDPPYGISYKSGVNSKASISTTGKRYSQGIIGDDKPFDPSPWLAMGPCAFTGAQHFAERLPGGSYHVWNKRGPYAPLDQADGDLIWVSGPKTALRVVDMVWRGLCRTVEHDQPIEHPTQKPVALMSWIIERLPGSPAVILDPYCGSGTTGVAALKLGRSFVGCEIDPEHFETACRRLLEAQRQPTLFGEAA
jgi:site-specific DNA-methyltransferase (adenine-specific)